MTIEADLLILHEKIDLLNEQFAIQQRKQEELEELKQDLILIGNQLFRLTIDELSEIGSEFELNDLLFLLKRVLRNTRTITELLDRLEAGLSMTVEANILGKQVFANIVETLDRLEREGYFGLARGGWTLLEQVVAEFHEEDLRALGESVPQALHALRNLAHPETLSLANRSLEALRATEAIPRKPSLLYLVRQLFDPRVRRGMARTLNLLKTIGDRPASQQHAKS